jgi:hypothetical protein
LRQADPQYTGLLYHQFAMQSEFIADY